MLPGMGLRLTDEIGRGSLDVEIRSSPTCTSSLGVRLVDAGLEAIVGVRKTVLLAGEYSPVLVVGSKTDLSNVGVTVDVGRGGEEGGGEAGAAVDLRVGATYGIPAT